MEFQYESAIDALLTNGLVDIEAASATKERFYDTLNEEKLWTTQKIRDYHETISLYMRTLAHDGMLSLTELVRQYSDESPSYVIQSWMRSRNTLDFLRQWELEQNAEFGADPPRASYHLADHYADFAGPKDSRCRAPCQTGQRRWRECLPGNCGGFSVVARSEGAVGTDSVSAIDETGLCFI